MMPLACFRWVFHYILVSSSLFGLSIALPFRNFALPDDIIHHGSTLMLATPRMAIIDADVFCRYCHQKWWIAYRKKRLNAFLSIRLKNPLYKIAYKDYSEALADVPIEAIDGEEWDSIGFTGPRKDSYGCFHGCQEVRTDLEWIIGTVLDNKRQWRAKWTYAVPCPPGMVPEQYDKVSRRERTAFDKEALKLLQVPKFAIFASEENIRGDENEIVKGCRCRPATEQDRLRKEEQLMARKKHRSQKAIFDKESGPSLATRKKRDTKFFWTDGRDRPGKGSRDRLRQTRKKVNRALATQTNQSQETMIIDTLNDAFEAFIQDPEIFNEDGQEIPQNQAVCTDMYLPEVELPYSSAGFGTTEAGSSRKHEEAAISEQNSDAQYVQATMSAFTNLEVPDSWYDSLFQ